MDTDTAVAAAAALVSFAFAASTLERWLTTRSRHELAWSVALVLFSAAAAALWWGAGVGWSGPAFRLFFLLGAILNVPVLALGTVYLLSGPRRGDRVALVTGAVLAFAVGVVVSAPMHAAVPLDRLPRGSEVFDWLPRLLAALASGLGAAVLFGGAVWSIARSRRAPGGTRRAVANVFIAAGTVVLSVGGLFNSVGDEMTAFGVSLVVGVVALFAGFIIATGRSAASVDDDAVTNRLDGWLGPASPPASEPSGRRAA